MHRLWSQRSGLVGTTSDWEEEGYIYTDCVYLCACVYARVCALGMVMHLFWALEDPSTPRPPPEARVAITLRRCASKECVGERRVLCTVTSTLNINNLVLIVFLFFNCQHKINLHQTYRTLLDVVLTLKRKRILHLKIYYFSYMVQSNKLHYLFTIYLFSEENKTKEPEWFKKDFILIKLTCKVFLGDLIVDITKFFF